MAAEKKQTDTPPENESRSTKTDRPVANQEGDSLLTTEDDVFDVGDAADDINQAGTIVTDKRSGKKSFFGTLGAAATQWKDSHTDAIKELPVFQKQEAPKVAPGSQRKEVIEKAVDSKRAALHDDHDVLIERMRTMQDDAERVTGQPFRIKSQEETDTTPTWTHTVGEEPANTPAPAPRKPGRPMRIDTPTEGTPTAAPEVTTRAAGAIEDYLPQSETAPLERGTIVAQDAGERVAPTTDVRTDTAEVEHVPAPTPTVVHGYANQPEDSTPAPEVTQPEPAPAPEAASASVLRRDTNPRPAAATTSVSFNTPRLVVVAGIAILILISVGAGGFYLFDRYMAAPQTADGVPVASFMSADARSAVPLANDRAALLATLTDTLAGQSVSISHHYLVYPNNETETPATTNDFFAVLAPRAPSAFVRSLSPDMMFGGVGTGDAAPYFIFKSNAFDTTFGGMLSWEQFMSADLAPLFGTPVSRTFAADARTADQTIAAQFTDARVGTRNVRVLYDETGQARIVYGFLNQNTLILTATLDAYQAILSKLGAGN